MSVMELADAEGGSGDRKPLRQRDGQQQVAEVWSTITHVITGQIEAYFQQLKARPDRRMGWSGTRAHAHAHPGVLMRTAFLTGWTWPRWGMSRSCCSCRQRRLIS